MARAQVNPHPDVVQVKDANRFSKVMYAQKKDDDKQMTLMRAEMKNVASKLESIEHLLSAMTTTAHTPPNQS